MKTGRQETQKKKNQKNIYTEIHEKIIQTLRKKNVFCDCVGRRPGFGFWLISSWTGRRLAKNSDTPHSHSPWSSRWDRDIVTRRTITVNLI